MNKTLLLSFLIFFVVTMNAQEVQIEIEKGYIRNSVYTVANEGFVCVIATDAATQKERDFIYKFYDHEMEFVKEQIFHFDKYTYKLNYIDTDEYTHSFYRTMSGKLIVYSKSRIELNVIEAKVDLPSKRALISSTKIVGDYAWFNMRIGDDRGVYKMNWRTGESSFYPIKLEGVIEPKITNIEMVPSIGAFAFVGGEVEKGFNHYAALLSDGGELQESYLIAHDKLLSVKVMEMSENEFLFAGTYSLKDNYKSEGLVISTVTDGAINFENKIKFSDISGFTELSGVSENRGNYVGNHQIIKTESGYIIIGEVCYRVTSRDQNNVSSFSHYQFMHGFVCVLDEDGQVAWSGTFKDQFEQYNSDISSVTMNVTKVDDETYMFESISGKKYFQVDLVDNGINEITPELATDLESKPEKRFKIDYKQEKVKTDDGKKMILTVTKISR